MDTQAKHASRLLDSRLRTEGNSAVFIDDGHEYIAHIVGGIRELIHSDETDRSVTHFAWRLSDVNPAGPGGGPGGVFDELHDAAESGVRVNVVVSGHAFAMTTLPFLRRFAWRSSKVSIIVDATAPTFFSSTHVKMTVFRAGSRVWAVIGSVDLAPSRFDLSHRALDTRRYNTPRGASHDTGLRLMGPAAAELHDRAAARWNQLSDRGSSRRVLLLGRPAAAMRFLRTGPAGTSEKGVGSVRVQVVETVPRGADTAFETSRSYLDLMLKVIDDAKTAIFIEDQYMTPGLRSTPLSRDRIDSRDDVLAHLRSALDRGVHIVVMVPHVQLGPLSVVDRAIEKRRLEAVAHLRMSRHADRLLVWRYALSTHRVYIHSKLLMADDEVMIIGSANVNARSLFYDYEMGVGVEDRALVTHARQRLWQEHFGAEAATGDLDADLSVLRALRPQHLVAITPEARTDDKLTTGVRACLSDMIIDAA